MELWSCHWRILVNLDHQNTMLAIGYNFVFDSSTWVLLPRKWHWNGKVTRGWHSTWVKTQTLQIADLLKPIFLPISAILWIALGYARICVWWVSGSWPIVINKIKCVNTKNYRPEQQNGNPYSYAAIFGINILAKVTKYFWSPLA